MTTRSAWRNALVTSRNQGLEEYTASLDAHPDIQGYIGHISKICISPIKSLGMLNLCEARVTSTGLTTTDGTFSDRSAMLGLRVPMQSEKFTRLSQREEPALALIKARITAGNMLEYSAPNIGPLLLSGNDLARQFGEDAIVQVTSDPSDVHPAVQDYRNVQWFRTFLHRNGTGKYNLDDVVLLRQAAKQLRVVEPRLSAGVSAGTTFTDGGQVLVASSSTLMWMDEQMGLSRPDFIPVEMNAFRPNIVLDGLPPNVEDLIDSLTFGTCGLRFADLCVRCPVTQVTQATGTKRSDKEPLAWLAKHRPALPPKNTGATFAVNAVFEPAPSYVLRVGEEAVVESEK